jgi:hypothetical protein
MPKRLLELRDRPLLDIVSHGRGGPKGGLRLPPAQIAAIDSTLGTGDGASRIRQTTLASNIH